MRLCGELQGSEIKNKLCGTQLQQPSKAFGFGGSGESHKKRLSLAPVRIKDDTLSTTLQDTKEGSMFVRVSVFSPCLLELCVLAGCPMWCRIQMLTEHSGVC